MKKIIKSFILLLFAVSVAAQTAAPKRPKITGVAHIGIFTKDLDNTREFFKDYLGYAEPHIVRAKDGSIALTIIKINDRQFVEIFPERSQNTDRFYHFALETDDAEAMRVYLESKGVKVPPRTTKGRTGNSNYFVTDPNGVFCEIVQYDADGMTAQNFGQDMPDTRISTRMSHVGFMTPDLDKAVEFYVDILGFREVWRGGRDGRKINWVHLQVPDGEDTIELMLYEQEQTLARMGTLNHLCLEVKDVLATQKILEGRTPPEGLREPTAPSVGINKKRQINYYTIDGTRIEIMEDDTVDGIPAPSSTGVPMKFIKTE